MFIGLFSFELVTPSPSIYFYPVYWFVLYCYPMFDSLVVFIVILTAWFWLPFRVLADYSLAFRLGTVLLLITWLMTTVCCLTLISACRIKSPIFFTLCIWVPHSLSLPFTVYNSPESIYPWRPCWLLCFHLVFHLTQVNCCVKCSRFVLCIYILYLQVLMNFQIWWRMFHSIYINNRH